MADPRALATLPERDYRGGMAEAVKHGLIADAAYFAWMEQEADALLRRDEAALTRLVRRSVEIKAEVVSGDERETGRRAILNAGHTVAHALEQRDGLCLPHGEAVALGLVAECALAEELGLAPSGVAGGYRPCSAASACRCGWSSRSTRADHRGHGDRQEESLRPRAVRPAQPPRRHGLGGRLDPGGAGPSSGALRAIA